MQLEITERPLITFALFAYNQEHLVREAVEGALSQTYSPLEIVLSDDCSGDGTYKILCELASGYRGRHRIVLNRNEKNLGVAGHVNKVMEISRGELIVAAAGDDISFPERVARTFEVWSRSELKADSIALGFESFSDEREGPLRRTPTVLTNIDEVIQHAGPRVIGTSHAWTRRLFDVFGPLPEWLHEEDVVLPFRALFLGGIAFDPVPVVRYRQHPGNTLSAANPSFKGLRGQENRYYRKLCKSLIALKGMALTIEQAAQLGLINRGEADRLQALVRASVLRRQVEVDLWDQSFVKRLRAGLMLWRVKTVRNYSILRKLFLSSSALVPQLRELEWRLRDGGRRAGKGRV